MKAPARKGKSILELAQDALFLGGATFVGDHYRGWRAFFAALGGQTPEDDAAADLIRRCTGRATLPAKPAREAWLLVGRRGGKSRAAAFLAVCLATKPYRFAPGERGTLIIIASDRRQARTVLRYIEGFFEASPMLRDMVAMDGKRPRITSESIELTNNVTIEVMTANFRALRGYTCVGCIADEIAFWPTDDSSNPDAEVLAALRPAMATVPDAMLIAITSVYAKAGETWRMFTKHFGKDGDVLVWKAQSRDMNPTLPQSVVDDAMERDPARAAAEYLSEFRSDVDGFLSREALEAVIEAGCRERAPLEHLQYVAFVDPSGGSSDSMTLAIAHLEDGRPVLDLLREERPPFSPEAVTERFVADLQRYRVARVVGDRYSGDWVREAFRTRGVTYEPSTLAKSDLYLELLPLVNAGQCVLLDDGRLRQQLLGLERRTSRGGRDAVDHPPHGRDDVANAAAGVLQLAHRRLGQSTASVVLESAEGLRLDYSSLSSRRIGIAQRPGLRFFR